MDVVYPLRAAVKAGYREFRYSLRTLKNLDHGEVFVIGGCPEWAINVVHIPTTQLGHKYENLCLNIETACKSDLISDPFVIMNDDFMILEPVEEITPHWRETVDEGIRRYKKRGGMDLWIKGMNHVKEACEALGIDNPLSYELHIPMVVHKQQMLDALAMIPPGPVWRTMYGNLAQLGGTKLKDVKVMQRELDVPEGPYCSTDDLCFPFGVAGRTIRSMFPEPSPYEAP